MGWMFENFADVLYLIWLAGFGDSRASLFSWQATSRQTTAQIWIFNWSTCKAGSKVGSKQNEFSQFIVLAYFIRFLLFQRDALPSFANQAENLSKATTSKQFRWVKNFNNDLLIDS